MPATRARTGRAITKPSGKSEVVRVDANPLLFNETTEAGIYTYKTGGRQGRFTVNLLDEEESNIAPRFGAGARATDAAAAEQPATADQALALWPMLVMAVFVLLVCEAAFAYRLRPGLPALALRGVALAALALSWINPRFFQPGEALDVTQERARDHLGQAADDAREHGREAVSNVQAELGSGGSGASS